MNDNFIDTYKMADVINEIIALNNYESYLEIGIENGFTYNAVKIANKESVDINKKNTPLTYHMTSDEMFKNMPNNKKYDIIFIDGLHDEDTVDRDIINSLKHLNKNGCILIHDVIPRQKRMATKLMTGEWYGDVYKSMIKTLDFINKKNVGIISYVHCGMGIIKNFKGCKSLNVPDYKISDTEYEKYFNDNETYSFYGKFNVNHLTPYMYEQFNVYKNKEELTSFFKK